MNMKIEGTFVTDDVTKLPYDMAVVTLKAMTAARDHMTEELSKLRKHIANLTAKPTLGDLIREHIKLVGKLDYPDVPIIDEGCMIKIPNPVANKEWTFANWAWVKTFCERHPRAYPVHRDELDNKNFTWIDCSNLDVQFSKPCDCNCEG